MMGPSGANILVPVAFLSWFPINVFFYKLFDKRFVPIIAYVSGWMFLPCAEYDIFMLRNTKTTVIGYCLLAAAWIFDQERLKNYEFDKVDIPMIMWCIAPFFASLFNGLGIYDGLSQTLYQTIRWGLPYYLGRVYFTDQDVLRAFAIAIFIGALVYVPFSLVELRMSPQFHRWTYGYSQHNILQAMRDGGHWRPMIFMDMGLMTSMWMMLGSILGTWLYISGLMPKKILSIPSPLLLAVLVLTFFMYLSNAAIIFFFSGLLVLFVSSKTRKSFLVLVLLSLPYLYVITRITGYWDGSNLVNFVEKKISPQRAGSIQFRFENETLLINRAMNGTFFGWGGYGRSRVHNDEGKDETTTDGLWIIAFGTNGFFGLAMLIITIQMPVIILMKRTDPGEWGSRRLAAPAAMAIFIGLTMIDNLLNAMVNPIYMIFSGGVLGMLTGSGTQPMIETGELDLMKEISSIYPRFIGNPASLPSRFIE